jgi:eukaryotic-like serine/threonine-protein kinase
MKAPDEDLTRTLSGEREAAIVLGPYRLHQRLGEGGMGEVWLAQQAEPVRRQVAVKILKAGMDSARVIARFEAERQTLAVMDHPCIAKVLDAGTTTGGRPYFVMEYVRGESIIAFCDRTRLSLRARLELFIQLCEGIQHAHHKGIIHRDLKPSNVLVCLVDDRPVPRIIDFGIAKAMAQPFHDGSLFTELGILVGTPEYMSPEQASMSADVDTRSDVYSLGVLLYELLTGRLPFSRDTFRRGGLDDIRRTIQEAEAPRPSTCVKAAAGDLQTIAANRQIAAAKLPGMLRGDLDWITMKALEKDRVRRYATANALAMDVRHYLEHEPVSAGPPTAMYRARKFAARHRAAMAAISSVAALLVMFAVVMALQARRIARERDRANQEAATARQVSDFLVGLFKVSDPSEARGNSLTAREILERGSGQIEKGLHDQPAVQAKLQATIGRVYTGLGLYAEAQPLLEHALGTQRRVSGEDLETLATAHDLANVYWYRGNFAEAEPLYRAVIQQRARILGENHPDTLRASFDLASIFLSRQEWGEFERLAQDTLKRQRRALGDTHLDTVASVNNLEVFYYRRGRFADAEPLAVEVFQTRRRVLGDDHPDTLRALHNLATLEAALGHYAEAERLYLEGIEKKRRILGPEHPDTCRTYFRLSEMYLTQGRFNDAESAALSAYRGFASRLGSQHADTRQTIEQLAAIYEATSRPADAATWRAKLAVK